MRQVSDGQLRLPVQGLQGDVHNERADLEAHEEEKAKVPPVWRAQNRAAFLNLLREDELQELSPASQPESKSHSLSLSEPTASSYAGKAPDRRIRLICRLWWSKCRVRNRRVCSTFIGPPIGCLNIVSLGIDAGVESR